MTPEQKAYAHFFYEGLIDRLRVAQARALYGEESMQFQHASAMNQANTALAHECLKEVNIPVAKAGWQGYLDGVQRYAAVGGPSFPREIEFQQEPVPDNRTVEQIVWDEVNCWMRDGVDVLPEVIELIMRGVDSITNMHPGYDVFTTLKDVSLHEIGEYGSSFVEETPEAIQKVKEAVPFENLVAVAELYDRAWVKGEGRH